MIGENTLKKYEYESINDYFNYIVESEINGNISQVRELIKRLSREQKKDFLKWLEMNIHTELKGEIMARLI